MGFAKPIEQYLFGNLLIRIHGFMYLKDIIRGGEAMEQAMAYVCCPAEESRVKVQRYCRKIYELGYVPICPRFGFLPFLEEGEAEDQQAYNRMSHLILKRCRMVVVCGKEVTGTMNTDISNADRLHIICTTLDGLIKIKEKAS